MNDPKRLFVNLTRGFGQALSRNSSTRAIPRFQPSFNPYTYTEGRWLDRDEEHRKTRDLHFDFDALLDVAVKSTPGAQRVVNCEKKEGGLSRVFHIHMDNGKNVVARLPTRLAGLPRLTVSSEVATLQFVKQKTTVPVPSVLSWDSETNNAIGAEYVITGSMPGVLLKDIWSTMTISQQVQCIRSVGYLCRELCSLKFNSYGSLYFRSNTPQGAVPLDDTFSIGPLSAPHHWGYDISSTPSDSEYTDQLGPWHNVVAYFSSLLVQAQSTFSAANQDRKSTEAYNELLNHAQQTMELIVHADILKDAADPILLFPNFHTRNILVDPTNPATITGIVDWQYAAIEPAFRFAANTPDFAEDFAEDLLHDATFKGEHDTDADERSPQEMHEAEVQFCVDTWAIMQQICPKYREACNLYPSITYLLAAASLGLIRNVDSMRTILTDLGDKWEELGLPDRCPYQPSEEESKELRDRLDDVHITRQLKEHLSSILQCDTDGWIPMEKWQEALPQYQEEYRRFLAACVEEGHRNGDDETRAIARANRIWPFDQR